MRSPRRHRLTAIAGVAAAGLLLLPLAATTLAKEGVEAVLDAPIGRDTPAGTELLVGMKVFAQDGDTTHPVQGTPMYLELTGPTGDVTRAMGVQDVIGHYTMRIAVPEGGVANLEVGIHGTSDLGITVVGTPLIGGGIGPRTAQAAPAKAQPVTPAGGAAATGPAPATAPGTADTGPGPAAASAEAIVRVVALALVTVAALGLLIVLRRSRGRRDLVAPPRAPGT
jgi:hypothetical protein